MHISSRSFVPAIQRSLSKMSATCSLDRCHSRQMFRRIPGGRQGIQLGHLWYCSVDCFVEAASPMLAQFSSRRVVEMPRAPRLSLGLALLSKGHLTPEQLRIASSQSERCGESLDATVARLGLVTDKQLAAARSAQWGYPVLAREHIGHIVQTDIPHTILDAFSAVPFHYSPVARRILLGFVFRVEHVILEVIESITACRAEACFVTPSDLAEQSERLARLAGYDEIPVQDRCTPDQMARTLGRTAVDISAREARLACCKNHIWARLAGKSRTIDVIFRITEPASAATCVTPDLRDGTNAALM